MTVKARFGFPLEYVADVEQVKRFYVDVLGLEVDRDHPTFVQFKDGFGGSFAIASDERLGGGDERELYWLVEDAEGAYEQLSRTAEISMPLKHLPFGKVFAVRDPAGQPQFLIELARERPSQQVS